MPLDLGMATTGAPLATTDLHWRPLGSTGVNRWNSTGIPLEHHWAGLGEGACGTIMHHDQ
jgi:hypothetical protein